MIVDEKITKDEFYDHLLRYVKNNKDKILHGFSEKDHISHYILALDNFSRTQLNHVYKRITEYRIGGENG